MAWTAGGVKDFLTPEDVESKTFTPVRLREGYDMAEVDQFLDEVASSLKTLIERNEAPVATGATAVAAAQPVAPVKAPEPAPVTPARLSTSEATTAAVRVLQLAEDEAAKTRSDADADAQRRLAAAEAEARRIEAEARGRADALDHETAVRRSELLGDLEKQRGSLTSEVEDLERFERDYRDRLRTYFRTQLDRLSETAGAPSGNSRLSALLDGDDSAV
jgi:DivIVA domain-containing protein